MKDFNSFLLGVIGSSLIWIAILIGGAHQEKQIKEEITLLTSKNEAVLKANEELAAANDKLNTEAWGYEERIRKLTALCNTQDTNQSSPSPKTPPKTTEPQ